MSMKGLLYYGLSLIALLLLAVLYLGVNSLRTVQEVICSIPNDSLYRFAVIFGIIPPTHNLLI